MIWYGLADLGKPRKAGRSPVTWVGRQRSGSGRHLCLPSRYLLPRVPRHLVVGGYGTYLGMVSITG